MRHALAALLSASALATIAAAPARAQENADVVLPNVVFEPTKVPADSQRLTVPQGFKLDVWAKDLSNPRMIAVADNGTVYVTRREGDVIMLRDADGDGMADGRPVTVASRAGMHGVTLHKGKAYLATIKEIFVADVLPDGRLGPLVRIVDDLPDAGQHPNRTLKVGPDEMLYVSVGSTADAYPEQNQENATILQMKLDGTGRKIWAHGLRNTIGFDWNLRTGELWGMDHGADHLGNDAQPEELNKLERGKGYGWPFIFGPGMLNPQDDPQNGLTFDEIKAGSKEPVLSYTAHSAPLAFAFYGAQQFPAEYRTDALVTMRGSWGRKPPSGYEVVRVRYGADGQPTGFQPFLTGFIQPAAGDKYTMSGRPVGLATLPDGSVLVGDDTNGVIYRVSYPGGATSGAMAKAPADAMKLQAAMGNNVPLALARPETAAAAGKPAGALTVTSPGFRAGAVIPERFSDYGEKVSAPLSWTAGPPATASYVVLMEDPDGEAKPVVHWVAWNIPAGTTSLPEGLPADDQISRPAVGIRQGRNGVGRVGYYGPRPPVGDKLHHYHFQVLALDTKLSLFPGADRDQVLAAARDHVLAKGEVVGTYRKAR